MKDELKKGWEIWAFCFDGMFMFGAPAGGVHVHRPQYERAGRKAGGSRPAKRPEGLSLDASAAPGNYAGAMDGEEASCRAFSFNSVR